MIFVDKIIVYIMWLLLIIFSIITTFNLIHLISDFIIPTYFNYEVVGDNFNIIRNHIMSIKEEIINNKLIISMNKFLIYHIDKLSYGYLFVNWILCLFVNFFKHIYAEINLTMENEFLENLQYSSNSFNFDEDKFCNNLNNYADADSSSNKYQASGVNPYKHDINPFLSKTKSSLAYEYGRTYRWFPDFKDYPLQKNVIVSHGKWLHDKPSHPPMGFEYTAYQYNSVNTHWLKLYVESSKVTILETVWNKDIHERVVSMKVREFNPFPYPLEKPPLTYKGEYIEKLPEFDKNWSNEAKYLYWKAEECNNRSKSEYFFGNLNKHLDDVRIPRHKKSEEYAYARDKYLREFYNKINKP